MEKNEKKCLVILLPTKERSTIWSYKGRRLYYDQANFNDEDDTTYYNLYIVSDEEIIKGDYFYDSKHLESQLGKCYGVSWKDKTEIMIDDYETFTKNRSYCKKIIATTDKSLTIKQGSIRLYAIPQPSESFIKVFIDEYNKGNVIKKVMVEYELFHGINTSIAEINAVSGDGSMNWEGNGDFRDFKLKINPKDNTITIRKIKDNYTLQEVKELCKSAFITGSRINDIDYFQWESKNL